MELRVITEEDIEIEVDIQEQEEIKKIVDLASSITAAYHTHINVYFVVDKILAVLDFVNDEQKEIVKRKVHEELWKRREEFLFKVIEV